MRYREVRLEVQSLESLRNRLFRRLVPQCLVFLLGRSRPAADASREVTQRWLLDGLDVSVGHRRGSRDPPSQKDAGRTPGSKKQANPLKRRGRLVWFFMRFRGPDGPKGQLRNYAQNTIRHYVRTGEDFARRFNCSPDRLGPRHVREYQAELFRKGKSPGTVTQRLAALRFFYVKTLRRAWNLADTPYPKRTRSLPTILSREEVAQLLHAARTPCERILPMTLYATGVRRSELTHLKINDIDSQRMVVHIRGGKGRKDRDAMLSPKLPTELRPPCRFSPHKHRPAPRPPQTRSPPHSSPLFRDASV